MKKSTLTPDQHRYAVESGIPVSPKKAKGLDYPFLSMEVGDSFSLASETYREYMRVRAAMSYWNKAHAPMHFALRVHRETGKYRCWRIA